MDRDVFFTIDFPILIVLVLGAFSCSLLGSFLVLRKQALIGDALSHVVLPGLAVAFMLTHTIAPLAMILGAFVSVLLAVFCMDVVRRFGGVEPGTAMGVVFTVFFALGVVLLEKGVGARVHLDASHALYGALETILWITPGDWETLTAREVWYTLPRQVKTLLIIAIGVTGFVVLLYKELQVTTFDPDFAKCLGIWCGGVNLALMVMVGVVAVGIFEAVGSILVIALFICPAATARMLTDRLSTYIYLSIVFGVLSGILGYMSAAWVPLWLGSTKSMAAAGMVAVVAGLFQTVAMVFGSGYRRRNYEVQPTLQSNQQHNHRPHRTQS